MNKIKLVVTAMLLSLSMGCTFLASEDSRDQLVANVAIQTATMKVIEGSDDREATAERVLDIVSNVQAVVQRKEVTTVIDLDKFVRSKIRWDELEPSDILLVNTLLEVVSIELENRVIGGSLSETHIVIISNVLENISKAASVY